jgi:hypothetical protein
MCKHQTWLHKFETAPEQSVSEQQSHKNIKAAKHEKAKFELIELFLQQQALHLSVVNVNKYVRLSIHNCKTTISSLPFPENFSV